MKLYILIIILIFSCSIKAKEKNSDLISYEKINGVEMITKNESFIINTTEKSIAYFDCLDRNSFVYITTDEEKYKSQMDERINGKFRHIEPNTIYYIRIYFMGTSITSNLIKYVYPLSKEKDITIQENLKYLHLQKDYIYTLIFNVSYLDKKLIKLSRKTLNTKIIINDEEELNDTNIYYKFKDDSLNEMKLQIKENDAFIEFLTRDENYDTLTDIKKTNYSIVKDTTVIIVKKTQKDFKLRLSSNEEFDFSFSYDFSDDETYFYNNMKPSLKPVKQEGEDFYEVTYEFNTPFKNISLSEKEYFTFTVKINRKSEQNVFLDYLQESLIDPILDEKLDKNYCEDVTKYLSEIFDLYIYTDIAKNPPQIKGFDNYHHRKIDIQKELKNIQTENRYFYEFYQEVMGLIATLKDLHLILYSIKTPTEFPFAMYYIELPFDFTIKQDKDEKLKIFIEINKNIQYYDNKTQQVIKNLVNIPLKTINDMDPFDYIQQFSKFRLTKNVHSQFTFTINYDISRFNLIRSPLNYSDFSLNDYEFENNYMLRLGYHIPEVRLENYELNNFYINYIESKQNEIQLGYFKFPTNEEIEEKYLIYKGIKKEKVLFKNINEEKIKWNITLGNDNNYLKCRVDEENKVNVVVQNSFGFDYYLGILKLIQCSKLFHTNNYPIIIIESLNGGGSAQLYMVMHQLFNMRIVDRNYYSYKMNDISRELRKNDGNYRTKVKTCEYVNSFDNYTVVKDHYNYNGENIEHIRSEAMDNLPFYFRNILKQIREEYKENKNLKRPTDIIIFTDSFSYSATSGLIKGFQNTGSAIIVGYYGNPKLKDTNLFDGSQSSSSVEHIEQLDVYKKLHQLGINVEQVTVSETFDDSVYGENPIPREYAFDPVDYRVDIYSKYSDNLYQDFIDQGKKIHKKFNEENYCNSKNEKLLLHSNCTIDGKEHAHGGYKCHPDKNEWNTSNCQPYYCDIGYFYNQYSQKCMEDCSYNDTKNHLLVDKFDYEEYEIDKKTITTFTFINENNDPIYFFKSSEDVVVNHPKIGFVKTETLVLNKDKNANKNFKLTLTKLPRKVEYLMLTDNFKVENIISFAIESIMILQLPEDHIFYGYTANNYEINKARYGTYNDSINLDDILVGNPEYFTEHKNNDGVLTLEKNKINILTLNYTIPDQVHYYITPKNTESNINIINNNTYFLYLQKDKSYELNFDGNTENRLIKLSRKTLKSTINIVDENVTLNKDNIYYQLENGFNGKIKLEVKDDDAILEFLFTFNNMNITSFSNKKYTTSNKFNLITIGKEYFSKNLTLTIKGGNDVLFNYYEGFSKSPYSYYNFENPIKLPVPQDINFTFFVKSLNLMQDEYYCILFENFGNNLKIEMFVEEDKPTPKPTDAPNPEKKLETWKIVVIVISSVIGVALIVIIIIYCIRRKHTSSSEIEGKMENLNDMN